MSACQHASSTKCKATILACAERDSEAEAEAEAETASKRVRTTFKLHHILQLHHTDIVPDARFECDAEFRREQPKQEV